MTCLTRTVYEAVWASNTRDNSLICVLLAKLEIVLNILYLKPGFH